MFSYQKLLHLHPRKLDCLGKPRVPFPTSKEFFSMPCLKFSNFVTIIWVTSNFTQGCSQLLSTSKDITSVVQSQAFHNVLPLCTPPNRHEHWEVILCAIDSHYCYQIIFTQGSLSNEQGKSPAQPPKKVLYTNKLILVSN